MKDIWLQVLEPLDDVAITVGAQISEGACTGPAKIELIKAIRAAANGLLGLKDSKDVAEALIARGFIK